VGSIYKFYMKRVNIEERRMKGEEEIGSIKLSPKER